ncbi:unnamed protein product [Cercospora beticola]|nr:unnamed protein product [Cercospora beticola]
MRLYFAILIASITTALSAPTDSNILITRDPQTSTGCRKICYHNCNADYPRGASRSSCYEGCPILFKDC